MKDTELITHDRAAFMIFLIGDFFGIQAPTDPRYTERYLDNIKETIKTQQKQIAEVRKFKEALEGLRLI